MDPEPTSVFERFEKTDQSSLQDANAKIQLIKEAESFKFNAPSIVLIGLIIAVSTLGVPLTAVLTERPSLRVIVVPTALKSNGSKPSLPLSISRIGEPGS